MWPHINLKWEREIWKDIPGYEGHYQVSNKGRVKGFKLNYYGRILSPRFTKHGYVNVGLVDSNKQRKNCLIHRLVMLAFKGPSDLQVNHINGNKLDNRPGNLEYVTAKENNQHAIETGLMPEVKKGEEHYAAKLTKEQVIKIREMHKTKQYSQYKLAELFGVSRGAISGIVYNVRWKDAA